MVVKLHKNFQKDHITIVYDAMWNGTLVMAENIACGIYKEVFSHSI